MKLSTLQTSTILAIALSNSALAQEVSYYLAYGDNGFATMNGRKVGDELIGGSSPSGLMSFKIRVMAKRVGGTTDAFGAGGIMLGLDWANKNAANYTSEAAYKGAQTNQIINSESVVWGKNLPGKTDTGELTTVDLVPIGKMNYSGSAGAGTSERPIGLWQAFHFGAGLNLHLELNKPVMLAEFLLGISQTQMASTAIWGDDPKESGLQIFGAENASTRFTFLGPTTGSGALRAPRKYILAIPEPASMLTLGGALVAFARRCRR